MCESRQLRPSYPALTVVSLVLLAFLLLPVRQISAEMVDRVVAVVNNEIITLSELDKEGETAFRKIAASSSATNREAQLAAARAEILETLIDKRLITQKAATKKLTVSDAEIDAAFQNVLNRTNMTREQLLAKLDEAGVDEPVYRSTLKTQLLQNKLVGADVSSKIVVTEDMILDYYDTHYVSRAKGEGLYLLQIGCGWQDGEGAGGDLSARKNEAKERVEKAHDLAKSGKDFGDLARKFSDLPSGADGGDIGTLEPDDMADDMRKAVADLKPGEISDVIETSTGYQFYKLLSSGEDAITKNASYEAVKNEIKQELYEQEMKKAYAQWVKELKDQAYIQKL